MRRCARARPQRVLLNYSVDDGELGALVGRFEEEYTRRYGAGARHGRDRIEYVRFGVDAVLFELVAVAAFIWVLR